MRVECGEHELPEVEDASEDVEAVFRALKVVPEQLRLAADQHTAMFGRMKTRQSEKEAEKESKEEAKKESKEEAKDAVVAKAPSGWATFTLRPVVTSWLDDLLME